MQGTRTRPLGGYYPRLVFFSVNGPVSKPLEDMGDTQAADVLAMVMAQLGMDGWEMVGAGPVGAKLADRASVHDAELHFLYFKRPKQ
jgi:hypothetical protein